MDCHLLFCKIINELMGDGPDTSEQKSNFDSVEMIETAWIIFLHHLDNFLDVFIGHLTSSNTLQIKNCGPALNFTWNHGLIDNVIQEIICSCHDPINFFSHLQNFGTANNDNWSERFVSFMAINNTFVQHFLDWIILKWVCGQFPLTVTLDLSCGDLVFPLFALKDPEQKSLLVVVTFWDGEVVLFAMFSEGF